jgi:membrane protein required for colicin V production
MNTFDAAVYLCLCIAIITGFRAGLLRSMATIVGYLAAMPAAVAAAPYLVTLGNDTLHLSAGGNWIAIFVVFLAIGFVLSALLRIGVSEITGPDVSMPDRAAGATLGALRVFLLAVLMVLIFDRIIPANRQPQFLATSHLRPLLSVAGQQGVKKLPPDIVAYIDRLKQERGI